MPVIRIMMRPRKGSSAMHCRIRKVCLWEIMRALNSDLRQWKLVGRALLAAIRRAEDGAEDEADEEDEGEDGEVEEDEDETRRGEVQEEDEKKRNELR